MKRWTMHRMWGVGLVVLMCAAWASPGFAQDSPGSVDSAWMAAMRANDVAAVMKCYALDAVMWLPGAPAAQGEAAIRKAYEGLLSANTVKDVSISNVSERMTGGAAVRWGSFSLTLAPKAGGEPAVLTGRFTEVLERRDGRWVYVVDHASAEPPPMAGTK